MEERSFKFFRSSKLVKTTVATLTCEYMKNLTGRSRKLSLNTPIPRNGWIQYKVFSQFSFLFYTNVRAHSVFISMMELSHTVDLWTPPICVHRGIISDHSAGNIEPGGHQFALH